MKTNIKLLSTCIAIFCMPFLCSFNCVSDYDNCENETEIETDVEESSVQITTIALTENDSTVSIAAIEETTEDIYEVKCKELLEKENDLSEITDKKEWFIAYKELISEYSEWCDPPETIYDYFSEEELDLLFRVVQAEVGDEYTFTEKCNVASVIFNRLSSEKFPDELSGILIASQFSTISSKRYKKVEVSDDTILACEYAFQIEDTANGCLFFESGNNNIHARYATYCFTDNAGHKFYK